MRAFACVNGVCAACLPMMSVCVGCVMTGMWCECVCVYVCVCMWECVREDVVCVLYVCRHVSVFV